MTSRRVIIAALVVLAACGAEADGTQPSPVPESTVSDEPEPPSDDPADAQPPSTEPPATEPPTTDLPATEPPSTDPPATDPPATERPATEPPGTDAQPQTTAERLAQIAIDDLVGRIGVTAADITVVSVEEVTWRDASLGCPRKGFDYAQVLTPGIRIVLAVDGTEYRYHGGGGQDPFYCAAPEAPLE